MNDMRKLIEALDRLEEADDYDEVGDNSGDLLDIQAYSSKLKQAVMELERTAASMKEPLRQAYLSDGLNPDWFEIASEIEEYCEKYRRRIHELQ